MSDKTVGEAEWDRFKAKASRDSDQRHYDRGFADAGAKVKKLEVAMKSRDMAMHTIRVKCEQYWNEHNIDDAEIHAVLEFIHKETYFITVPTRYKYEGKGEPAKMELDDEA